MPDISDAHSHFLDRIYVLDAECNVVPAPALFETLVSKGGTTMKTVYRTDTFDHTMHMHHLTVRTTRLTIEEVNHGIAKVD